MANTATEETLTVVQEQYEVTRRALEATRLESRKARAELIEAIMCDKKDVLVMRDIADIADKLSKFLEVQNRLGKEFLYNANAHGMLLWEATGV